MRMFFKKSPTRQIISHLTDVEGNLSYFKHYFNRSEQITYLSGQLSFKSADSKAMFVYGGDFCDKGPGDIRIGNALTDFKKRYPHQVFLLAGNREIKYRRFTYELNSKFIRQRFLQNCSGYWSDRSSPRHFLRGQLLKTGRFFASELELDKYIKNISIEACQIIYLQWMLEETMGCGTFQGKPCTFEQRRMELAACQLTSSRHIDDFTVMKSFIDAVSPDGFVTTYLKNAQIGAVIDDTLFLHGAITPEGVGYVPGYSKPFDNVTEWISQLNNWYTEQINDWLDHPEEDYLHEAGHKPLDRYVLSNPKSTITTNWYTKGQLKPIAEHVIRFLNNSGIYRVISGHQPFSDFPLIIRNNTLEIIVGDTSYSDPSAPDNRGKAIHNLEVYQTDKGSYSNISAIRKNGSAYNLQLPPQPGKIDNDLLIGSFSEEGCLIRPESGGSLVHCQLNGHDLIERPLFPEFGVKP